MGVLVVHYNASDLWLYRRLQEGSWAWLRGVMLLVLFRILGIVDFADMEVSEFRVFRLW